MSKGNRPIHSCFVSGPHASRAVTQHMPEKRIVMNIITWVLAGSLLAAVPALACARAGVDTEADQWTGPYVGAQLGFNQSSVYDLGTQDSLTGGILGGYNLAVPTNSTAAPIIVGGDAFAEFNSQSTHHDGVDYGSNVVGVDFMAGYPLGIERNVLPYVKVGVGDLSATGDLDGSGTSARVGLGAEYQLRPHLAVDGQWMHQDAHHITNNNFTVGLDYEFSLQ